MAQKKPTRKPPVRKTVPTEPAKPPEPSNTVEVDPNWLNGVLAERDAALEELARLQNFNNEALTKSPAMPDPEKFSSIIVEELLRYSEGNQNEILALCAVKLKSNRMASVRTAEAVIESIQNELIAHKNRLRTKEELLDDLDNIFKPL